jgi:hypothetical protein
LVAVDRTLRAVDVEDHPPPGRSRRGVLNQFRVQVSESLIVSLVSEDVGLEPMQGGGERHAGLSPLPRSQHPKRRILGQSLSVIGILVVCQAAVDRLPEQVRQWKLPIASGAGIGEVSLDQGVQAEALVEFTRE